MDPSRPCLNCGDPTVGEFCPSCGQRKVDVQVSLRTLFMDLLEDQFILDRRLPHTLSALLFKPGLLTVEHVNGRIVRYIHPFRLYLVTSLLFFLLFSFFSLQLVRRAMAEEESAVAHIGPNALDSALADLRVEIADTTATEDEIRELRRMEAELLERQRGVRLDSLSARVAELTASLEQVDRTTADTTISLAARRTVQANRPIIARQLEVATAQRDTLLADTLPAADAPSGESVTTASDDRPLREVFGWDENPPTIEFALLPAVDSTLEGQVRRIGEMTAREATETLLGTFLSYVPTMMFILLPVFAAVLKLLYVRRRRFYAEHFVFLLHVHSVVFILATIVLLLREHVGGWLEAILGGWILIYIFLAMKRVYGQSWLKTFVKYWTLGWSYFWVFTFSIPIAFIATLLFF